MKYAPSHEYPSRIIASRGRVQSPNLRGDIAISSPVCFASSSSRDETNGVPFYHRRNGIKPRRRLRCTKWEALDRRPIERAATHEVIKINLSHGSPPTPLLRSHRRDTAASREIALSVGYSGKYSSGTLPDESASTR